MARLPDLLGRRVDGHDPPRPRPTWLLRRLPDVALAARSFRAWLTVGSRPDPVRARRLTQISGLVFISAGLVKFAFHGWELHAFRDFGIPAASVMEPIVGVLETVGGALLLARRLLLPTAFVLAVIMLVAFVAGGIIHGSPIPSDTLAPALLVAMIWLLRRELHEPTRRTSGWLERLRSARKREPSAL
jgi:uncharacterized membrane protein YphA (DoxX/SURF4 family)